jgi:hypothetical protein
VQTRPAIQIQAKQLASNYLEVGVPPTNGCPFQPQVRVPIPTDDGEGLFNQANPLPPRLPRPADKQFQGTGEAAGLGEQFVKLSTHEVF